MRDEKGESGCRNGVEDVRMLGEGVEHTCLLLVVKRDTASMDRGRCWQVRLLVLGGKRSCGTSHQGSNSLDTRHDEWERLEKKGPQELKKKIPGVGNVVYEERRRLVSAVVSTRSQSSSSSRDRLADELWMVWGSVKEGSVPTSSTASDSSKWVS